MPFSVVGSSIPTALGQAEWDVERVFEFLLTLQDQPLSSSTPTQK